jgi:hypothetical protein
MTAAALAAAISDRLHVTHQWRRTNLSPRFWLIGGPIRPCADRKTNRTLQLRQDTPPNAFARDSLLVADLLARGSLSLAAFPEALTASSGKIGHRLAAYSCGGSRGITRKICARTAFPFDPLREPPTTILEMTTKAVKQIQSAANLESL